jgi:hypothetical protein
VPLLECGSEELPLFIPCLARRTCCKSGGSTPPHSKAGSTFAEFAAMGNLLWLIIVVLIVLWLGGFAMHIGGGLIHILIVIALVLLIVRLATGRRVL